MAQPGTALLHRWMEEVWNQGREATIDELMADDAMVHGLEGPGGNEMRGPAAFKAYFHQFRSAFPDLHVTVEDAVWNDDTVAIRFIASGTHTGPGLTPAPTGKAVSFTGMCFARIKNGKLVEGWNNVDMATMNQQLGIV